MKSSALLLKAIFLSHREYFLRKSYIMAVNYIFCSETSIKSIGAAGHILTRTSLPESLYLDTCSFCLSLVCNVTLVSIFVSTLFDCSKKVMLWGLFWQYVGSHFLAVVLYPLVRRVNASLVDASHLNERTCPARSSEQTQA